MASYTFDPTEVDAVREEAEARALDVGSKLVDDQAAAREEGYQRAREQVSEESRYAGKYKSAEDLEKAYLELQRKLGEKSSEEPAEEPQEAPEDAPEDDEDEEDDEEVSEALQALVEASAEFDSDSGLSEATLEKLSQLDSRTLVENWIEYIKSQKEQVTQATLTAEQANSVKEAVGGDKSYSEMIAWAAENLSPDEIAAYDSVMNSNDYGAMYWAAQGLKARFVSEGEYEGKSYSGRRAPAEPGFRSQAELARAIADPRYRNDPAYRMDVEDKLARSGDLM